ncbi:MAG: hypothetical protein ABUS57_03455 [Pseudomonadota bacterium]
MRDVIVGAAPVRVYVNNRPRDPGASSSANNDPEFGARAQRTRKRFSLLRILGIVVFALVIIAVATLALDTHH